MAYLTVQTKLLDKTLDGARIIDMSYGKTCQCFVLPRDGVIDVSKIDPSIKQYSFYILLGEDKSGKPMAYIGQTNDFTNRVNDHKLKKDFWNKALVFVSKINDIYTSEALYLEYLGWSKAKEVNNYKIDNDKNILKPSLPSHKKNDMELFFEEIIFLTRFYGCDVFDAPKGQPEKKNYEEYYIKMPKKYIQAIVHYFPDTKTFILKKGSTLASLDGLSCPSAASKLRARIKKDSKLSMDNGYRLLMLDDVDITSETHSPSGAACVITGTAVDGTNCFVDKHGFKFGMKHP